VGIIVFANRAGSGICITARGAFAIRQCAGLFGLDIGNVISLAVGDFVDLKIDHDQRFVSIHCIIFCIHHLQESSP